MSCDSVRDQLDHYIAGLIEPAAEAAIRDHLRHCVECQEDEAAARFLAPRVAALPRSLAPSRPLWNAIEVRLAPRRTAQLGRWLPLAAAIALLAAAGLWRLRQDPGDSTPVVQVQAASPQAASYRMAAAEMQASLLDDGMLAPETASALRRDMKTMDAAIEETSSALRSDPGNEVLRDLHLSALRRKLDVLRRTAALYAET